MNDNLYQSKAGVFTAGWFLWPPITCTILKTNQNYDDVL